MLLLVCVLITSAFHGADALTQADLDYIGANLDVYVKLTDNLKNDERTHLILITLANKGSTPINTNDLHLYFYSFFMVEPDFLPNKQGYVSTVNKIRLFHVNGMLFRAEFLPEFGVIAPGSSRQLSILAKFWAVSRTDVHNNWYVTANGLEPRTLVSTSDQALNFVLPFKEPNQWKRYPNDVYDPVSPQDRMSKIKARDLGSSRVKNRIIPTPLKSIIGTQHLIIEPFWVISAPSELKQEANYLSSKLGLQVTSVPRNRAPNVIFLEIMKQHMQNKERYSLEVSPNLKSVVIRGQSKSGVFYGIQTLLSLHDQTKADLAESQVSLLPQIRMVDSPRFPYRGLLLDVARNFHPKEAVMRLIDAMSMYKLNKLHLHLSDDEGWRLQIPGLPDLTQIGAKRCHDPLERRCINPQLGSGPFATPPGSGFYNTTDYQDILRHAASRHVEIIPGFTMPAHAHAIVKAMDERFRRTGNATFLVAELGDTSKFLSTQMFSDDVMNPCIETTYNFIKSIVSNVKVMHAAAGSPLKTFNFEGESVPEGSWQGSPACAAMFPNVSKRNISTLAKVYFLSRIADILVKQETLTMGAFEEPYFVNGEVISGGNTKTLAIPFQTVWEWGLAKRAYVLANAGYSVVMSPVTHLSFDHPYEPDPTERGLYWAARFVDTYKTFHLRPDNIYLNIDVKRSGETINHTQVCGTADENCPPLQRPENVKGLQGMLWSELIKTQDQLDYMAFPRVLALAERAWHKSPWEDQQFDPLGDWEEFVNTVGYNELPRLEEAGIKYRVPPPGATLKDSLVTIQTVFPGLQAQYSADNGTTWANYTYPIYTTDSSSLRLRALSPGGQRTSRVIKF